MSDPTRLLSEAFRLEVLAAVASFIGIVRLIWPEGSRLVREIWHDLTAAALAVRDFKKSMTGDRDLR